MIAKALTPPDSQLIRHMVKQAIKEDIGPGDLSAVLLPQERSLQAKIITREAACFCGQPWLDAVYSLIDPRVSIDWHTHDGARVTAGQTVCTLHGKAVSLLAGERIALNYLQTLCATATTTATWVRHIAHTACRLLDTRKTLPGWRAAQKYAVRCGGGYNHRFGLFDAIMIKENHILACGSIAQAVTLAKQHYPSHFIEVEVETLDELEQAIATPVDRILLDNFNLSAIRDAVTFVQGKIPLEASGGISFETLQAIAETGVDFISVGALTKHIRALDLSLLIQD